MKPMPSRFSDSLRTLRGARFIALMVIAVAIVVYIAPYIVGSTQCVTSAEQSVRDCLGQIYNEARSDTNLAAGVIALAVILAAWRPVPESAD